VEIIGSLFNGLSELSLRYRPESCSSKWSWTADGKKSVGSHVYHSIATLTWVPRVKLGPCIRRKDGILISRAPDCDLCICMSRCRLISPEPIYGNFMKIMMQCHCACAAYGTWKMKDGSVTAMQCVSRLVRAARNAASSDPVMKWDHMSVRRLSVGLIQKLLLFATPCWVAPGNCIWGTAHGLTGSTPTLRVWSWVWTYWTGLFTEKMTFYVSERVNTLCNVTI
jgi:hypothetical protein